MRDQLLHILNTDTTYNKCATKYLYKREPELWARIVSATSFLPDNAKPKQRVWHVINDIWSIPLCPVTQEPVKWWDNRYLETLNRSAKATHMNKIGRLNNRGESVDKKRAESNKGKTVESGLRKAPDLSEETKKERVAKNKQTCLDRYGVDNGGKSKQAREKVSDARVRNGATPRELRSLRRLYYDAVWVQTEIAWKEHFDDINPQRLRRSENALDHIYSIQQGFRESIPPYIIGHWTNLRVITKVENSVKGMRCDKQQEQLFTDFFNSLVVV